MSANGPVEIHVVADSTGDTAARVARAVQVQYSSQNTRIIRHPRVQTPEGLRAVFERLDVPPEKIVVFTTIVDDQLRALVEDLCSPRGIEHVDLLGPAINAVARATGSTPTRKVQPVGFDPDYFKRIRAMEFTIANDDGRLNSSLNDAEVVLIGASRTGKTPLSMYMGYLGYKTANIPLVPHIAPPPELFTVEKWKVVGLTIDPERLMSIRQRRVKAMGARRGQDGYTELTRIYDELDTVRVIQRRIGCPVIDTTSLALEEAAGRVIELIESRRRVTLGT